MKKKNSKTNYSPFSKTWSSIFIVIILLIGVLLRLLAAKRGFNFDMQSYFIVADILHHGGNVYAETTRYNYGPVWFNFLNIFNTIALFFQKPYLFRYLITGFLTVVDIGIFFVLLKKFGKIPAILFFLNPISIIITGYHSQFDNFAILMAMVAVLIFGEDTKKLSGRKIIGSLLLGLSLSIKHIFFIFPLWLALKQKGLLQKVAVLCIPFILFLASFIPYLGVGQLGIINNVFNYRSFNNYPLWDVFFPHLFLLFFNPLTLLEMTLVIFGFIFRKKDNFNSLLLYTIVLVIFSPAIANQYLAIPVPAISVYMNWIFLLYSLSAGHYYMKDPVELGITHLFNSPISPDYFYRFELLLLFFGFVWMFYKEKVVSYISYVSQFIFKEFQTQLKEIFSS